MFFCFVFEGGAPGKRFRKRWSVSPYLNGLSMISKDHRIFFNLQDLLFWCLERGDSWLLRNGQNCSVHQILEIWLMEVSLPIFSIIEHLSKKIKISSEIFIFFSYAVKIPQHLSRKIKISIGIFIFFSDNVKFDPAKSSKSNWRLFQGCLLRKAIIIKKTGKFQYNVWNRLDPTSPSDNAAFLGV